MALHIAYTFISVIIVSLVSLVGIILFTKRAEPSHKLLLILVSLSAGTLFGGALLHLLPEAIEEVGGMTTHVSVLVLGGILSFFILEKFIHYRHCHHNAQTHIADPSHSHGHTTHKSASVKKTAARKQAHKKTKTSKENASKTVSKAIAPINLTGDALHNFLDGLVIAGAYAVSVPAGIATTVAVVLHEIPQEIADFGVLLYAGFSKTKAIFFNLLSASFAIVGAGVGLLLGNASEQFSLFILPFAAGGFLYIAGANLVPELHKHCEMDENIWHFFAMLLGLALMFALLFLE